MILKGADVRARTLVVPHSFAGLTIPTIRTANGGPPSAAAQSEAEERARDARDDAARLIADAEAEAQRLRAEAQRVLAQATAEAERMRAQAQVELGRAKAEAEQLVTQARARLEEAGETITTLAEARQILVEHQADAAQVVADAEAKRQEIFDSARAEGYQAGHAAGYAEGTERARAELSEQLELAFGVAAQAVVDREALIAAAEPDVVRLAMDVARKLIAREVEADPDVLKGLVTRAMLKAAGDGAVRLRLNPQTIDRLSDYLADLAARFATRGVELVPDMTVEPAGAIVETRTGSVDARLSTQLNKVERSLLALAGESA